jgi:hypothetical protein
MSKSADKFYPTNNVKIDLRTSCTVEEAAAKLIGWMKGHVRHAYPDVVDDDITPDHLTYTDSLGLPLHYQLALLREAAWNRYNEAVCAKLPEEIIEEKYAELENCEELISKVVGYLSDINEEINKGDLSALVVDQRETEFSGELHITLRSLDKWARNQYQIPIIAELQQQSVKVEINVDRKPESHQDALADGWLSPTLTRNLNVSFALLIEEFVSKWPEDFFDMGGKLIVKNLAAHLVKCASVRHDISGQKLSAIEDRINDALKELDGKPKNRRALLK